MRFIGDPTSTISGWFSRLLTQSGWFDQELTDDGGIVQTQEAEDSRFRLKRHAKATLEGARGHASTRMPSTIAAGVAFAQGAGARGTAGIAGAKAVGRAYATISGARGRVGSITARASSQHAQTGAQAHANLSGNVTGAAAAAGVVRGAFARTRIGAPVNVEVGPDEVAQELEEILFLLEVA